MDAGLHYHKITLGQRFQFVRREERSLHHLQGFRRIVLAPGYRARHDRAATQGFRQRISRRAVWGKATEQSDLCIVHDDLAAFLAVVLFKLGEGLDDRDDLQASGSGRTEHHLRGFNLRQCAELIAEEDTAVLELTAVLICNSQDLTVELLDDKGNHEEGVGVFLWHDDKDRRFLAAEFLGVNLRVKAQELFKLGIQEGVQPGERRGHDGCHALLGGVQGGSGEPFGFVIVGEHLHELLELILAFLSRWSQQLLDDLEHGYDVPFFGLAELCHQ